jgi:hypothetical protein
VFQSEDAELAQTTDSNRRAFHRGVEDRRKALDALAARIGPPGVVTLNKPFLIFSNRTLVDSQIEPLNSFARFKVDTNTGGEIDHVTFYFFWENDADHNVVLNVTSSLVLNGRCAVGAGKGIFSGHSAWIDVFAEMNLFQWWNQPPTMPLSEASQFQQIVFLQVEGGGLFGDPDSKQQIFSFAPFEFSYTTFLVPPQSPVVIEVSLFMSYNNVEGGDINDFVINDFEDANLFRRVICPAVELELQEVNRPPAAA